MPKQFIFIMTDTQRADMVGRYGNSGMITPALDRLSEEGIRFTNAYTTQPVCGPARSALFTGLFPHSNGSWGNCIGLESTVKTVGERLTHEGIHTAYIGKWHLDGGDYFGLGKCPEGWDADYWYDMRNYLDELSEDERFKSRQVSTITKGDGIDVSFTYGRRCSDRAIDFIQKHKDEDFLLIVSYDEPHHPFLAPKKYTELYKDYHFPISENIHDTLENKPEHQRVWAGDRLHEDRSEHKLKFDSYFGSNTFVDDEIGRVLEAYRQNTPEALIMYTSDHGDHLDSHRLISKGASMYEEITNIPFIISGKSLCDTNIVNPHPISHIDVTPTILDYFNVPKYPMLQGKSLLPLVTDGMAKINEEIFIEFGRYEVAHDFFGGFQPIRCIYDGRYKLVINLLSSDELYDLETDPVEMINLIENEECISLRNTLHDKLLNWMNETRDPFRGYYWERRPWRTDARVASWNYTGYCRQKHPDYDEVTEYNYGTALVNENPTYINVPPVHTRENELENVPHKN